MFHRIALTAALALTAGALHAERLTDQPLVTADWLSENLGHDSLLVIDVRDPVAEASVHAAGHIPGAVSAPYGSFGWRETVDGVPGMLPPVETIAARIGSLGVDGDTHVVIVSEGSDSSEFGKATRVYWTFKVLGHDAVSILDGGQIAWAAAGGAISQDETLPEPATFTAAFRPELVAKADDVHAAIENGVELVDGRPAAQFSGAEKAPVARVAGTIPTAISIEQGSFYDGTFASQEIVARLTEAAGVTADEEVIAFCNTGHWASIVWFGLSEVGGNGNVALYDGSMADWTANEANPVVVE